MDNRDIMRGIGLGLIVGGVISIALSRGERTRNRYKNHAIKAVGEAVENVTDKLGF